MSDEGLEFLAEVVTLDLVHHVAAVTMKLRLAM
jgi:hypothetical protein